MSGYCLKCRAHREMQETGGSDAEERAGGDPRQVW